MNKFRISNSDLIIIIILLVMFFSYGMIKLFTIKSESFLNDFARNKSIQLTNIIINKALYEILYNVEYDSLMNTSINNEEFIDIELDNYKINKMLYVVNDNILENINLIENGNFNDINIQYLNNEDFIFKVPIGVIYNVPILVGMGPQIPFKVNILGNSDNSVYTKVKEYGINNSII